MDGVILAVPTDRMASLVSALRISRSRPRSDITIVKS